MLSILYNLTLNISTKMIEILSISCYFLVIGGVCNGKMQLVYIDGNT